MFPRPSLLRPPRRSSGFAGMLTGGILAAIIGFGLARFVVPEGWPMGGNSATADAVSQQGETLKALQAEVARVSDELNARPDAAAVSALVAQSGAAAELEPRLEALESRLTEIEEPSRQRRGC